MAELLAPTARRLNGLGDECSEYPVPMFAAAPAEQYQRHLTVPAGETWQPGTIVVPRGDCWAEWDGATPGDQAMVVVRLQRSELPAHYADRWSKWTAYCVDRGVIIKGVHPQFAAAKAAGLMGRFTEA